MPQKRKSVVQGRVSPCPLKVSFFVERLPNPLEKRKVAGLVHGMAEHALLSGAINREIN